MSTQQSAFPPTLRRRLALGLVFGFLVLLASAMLGDLRQVGQRLLAFRWELHPAVLGLTLFNYTSKPHDTRRFPLPHPLLPG
ncbi:MAG: hypothetical protein PHS96_14630 [Anaerolineales bacterium]|nr:hypothetical protein [Anaerolineales bacterium]